jgi:hypothetical protein
VTSDNQDPDDGHSPDEATTHRHPPRPDLDDTLTYYRAMEIALRELLVEKGVFTPDDIRRQVEDMDNRKREMGFTAQSRHDRAAGGVQRASFVARSVKRTSATFAKWRARINTRERTHLCVGQIRRPAHHAANRSKSPDHRRAVHRFAL